jgi:hypothetical protein
MIPIGSRLGKWDMSMTGSWTNACAFALIGGLFFGSIALGQDDIELTIKEPSGVARSGWPVTSGVPLPKGLVRDIALLRLLDTAGKEIPCQKRALARWIDESVKSVLVDFQTDLQAGEARLFRLSFTATKDTAASQSRMSSENPGNYTQITTGPARFRFRERMWAPWYSPVPPWSEVFHMNPTVSGNDQWGKPLKRVSYPVPDTLFDEVWIDANGDGTFSDDEKTFPGFDFPAIVITDDSGAIYASQLVLPKYIETEETGPLRTVIKIKGYISAVHPEGHVQGARKVGFGSWQDTTAQPIRRIWFEYVARVHLYAGKSHARVQLTISRGGNDPYGFWGMDFRFLNDLVALRNISFHLPLTPSPNREFSIGTVQDEAIKQGALLSGERVQLAQNSGDAFDVEMKGQRHSEKGRAPGWAALRGGASTVLVAVRDFAPRFPKALELSENGLVRVGLWEVAKDAQKLPGVGQGFSCTHDIYVDFSMGQGAEPKTLAQELFAVASPEWMCSSGVFGDLVPHVDTRFPDYWKFVVGNNFNCAQGQGVLNYLTSPYEGAKHGSGLAESTFLQFAMSADLAYFNRAHTMVTHDAETYSHLPIERGGMVAVTKVPPVQWVSGDAEIQKALAAQEPQPPLRERSGGCYFVCRQISIALPMRQYELDYLLTGNERIREVMSEIARFDGWGVRGSDGSVRGEDGHGHWRRLFGHALLDLLQEWEISRDEKMLAEIRFIVAEMLKKPFPKAWPLNQRSNANFHGVMGFTTLARAAALHDRLFGTREATDELVVRTAREYIAKFWDAELKTFRYNYSAHHEDVEKELPPQPVYLENLHFLMTLTLAYEASGEDSFMEIGRACYRNLMAKTVPEEFERVKATGGKEPFSHNLMRSMRTLPHFLAALDRFEKGKGLESSR